MNDYSEKAQAEKNLRLDCCEYSLVIENTAIF